MKTIKTLMTLSIFILSMAAWARPQLYFVKDFEGVAKDKLIGTLLYCGEEGDFAAEEYCYQLTISKEKIRLINAEDKDTLYYVKDNNKLELGILTKTQKDLYRGPDGSGILVSVKLNADSVLEVKEKKKWVINQNPEGVPVPPFIVLIPDGLNFKLKNKSNVLESVHVHGGFYLRY